MKMHKAGAYPLSPVSVVPSASKGMRVIKSLLIGHQSNAGWLPVYAGTQFQLDRLRQCRLSALSKYTTDNT